MKTQKMLSNIMNRITLACIAMLLAACGGGKPEGPSDEAIRKDVAASEAQIVQVFGVQVESHQVRDIVRGEPLTTERTSTVPSGTVVFPIKYTIDRKLSDPSSSFPKTAEIEVFFYKDTYGEWKSASRQTLLQ